MKLNKQIMGASIVTMLASFLPVHFTQAQEQVENLSRLNSSFDEQHLIISPDGEAIYFTRAHHRDNAGGNKDKGDIWVSFKEGTDWAEPVRLTGDINNELYNAAVGFVDENTLMVFYHNMSSVVDSKSRLGLHLYKRSGNQWIYDSKVNMPSLSNKSTHQSARLTADGQVMVIAMESYGSYGNEDIYVSFRQPDGAWSDPQNLGPDVNTYQQEMTPFLASDKKTLYFSSNGYGGFGGRDIYVSKRLDDTWERWSTPVNLGPEVNSIGVELSFTLDPDDKGMAYFTTTQDSEGFGDVVRMRIAPADEEEVIEEEVPEVIEEVMIEEVVEEVKEEVKEEFKQAPPVIEAPKVAPEPLRPELVVLKGRVLNINTMMPVKAEITLINMVDSSRQTVSYDTLNGEFYEAKNLERQSYQVEVRSSGFLVLKQKVEVTTSGNLLARDFLLTPIEVGTAVKIENVLFKRGTATFADEQVSKELDQIYQLLVDNPQMEIRLEGHTDNLGNPNLNQILSERRVEAVKSYLVGKGIAINRIATKGYGGTRPVASNQEEAGRELNRRVEFVITKF